MNISSENQTQRSARIYQFPLGGRRGLTVERASVTSINAIRSECVVDTDGYYHEAAVEAERVRQ
jgi:hypothetical protein